jgi:hypothetical protein
MRWILRQRPSPAMVVALIALLAATAGTTMAAGTISKKKRHADEKQDIALIKKYASKLRGPAGPEGRQGAKGDPGAAGGAGAAGAAGAAGTARAYGLVASSGTLSSTIRKNVASVSNPSTGTFCITLAAGIDSATTLPNATLTDDSDTGAIVFVPTPPAPDCPSGQLEVITVQDTDSGATAGTAFQETSKNEGFFFSVP